MGEPGDAPWTVVLVWKLLHDDAAALYATGSVLTDPAVGTVGDVDSTAVTIRTIDLHQLIPQVKADIEGHLVVP